MSELYRHYFRVPSDAMLWQLAAGLALVAVYMLISWRAGESLRWIACWIATVIVIPLALAVAFAVAWAPIDEPGEQAKPDEYEQTSEEQVPPPRRHDREPRQLLFREREDNPEEKAEKGQDTSLLLEHAANPLELARLVKRQDREARPGREREIGYVGHSSPLGIGSGCKLADPRFASSSSRGGRAA